jgi:hypothetical protein
MVALMHHVMNADAFVPVSSVILNRLSDVLQGKDNEKPEVESERLTELANVLIEVRKGSRVNGKRAQF